MTRTLPAHGMTKHCVLLTTAERECLPKQNKQQQLRENTLCVDL